MSTVNSDELLDQIREELAIPDPMEWYAARAHNEREARRLLAMAHQKLADAKPLYEAAHAWLLAGGGELAVLHRLAVQISEIEASVNIHFNLASGFARTSESDLEEEARNEVGLPAWREWVPDGTPDFCRVFWRALVIGLIGPKGVGHPDLHGVIPL